jgi:Mn-dependent DtxR family transcriptional regulator
MQSPLAVFLYLLMRDHLPVATVKWMLEQAKLPGDPKFDAPELEALAQRFSEQLEHLAERPEEPEPVVEKEPPPPPPPDPPAADWGGASPPTPPADDAGAAESSKVGGDGKVSADTVTKTREWLRGRRRVKPGDLDEALGYSSATRARVIRALREEGFIDVEYEGHQRVLVVVAEIAEHLAGNAVSNMGGLDGAAGETRKPSEAEATPPPAEEEEDEEIKPPPAPARSGETDIELMARVSDYIKDASERNEAVWPRELEEHFSINRDRRQRIIEMLVQRQRIVVRKPNSPHVHYTYRQGSGNPDFRFEHDDEAGLGDGKVNLKDPEVERRVAAIAERDETNKFIVSDHMDTIRAWARGSGNFTARQVQEVFRVSPATAQRVVSTFRNEGFIEQVGEDGRTSIYCVVAKRNGSGPGEQPGKRPLHAGGDGSTLDGRALGIIEGSGGLTISEVSTRLGVEEDVARGVLGKLYREGEVRPQRQEGITRYVAV